MDLDQLLAYTAFALVNAIVPGPNLLVTVRALLSDGARAAHATLAGIGTGVTLYGLGSSWGLAQLAAASPLVYGAIKLTGAAWVYWIGMQLVRRGFRPTAPPAPLAGEPGRRAQRRHFGIGFLTALVNPNIVLFFLAVLPQFAGAEPDSALVLPAMILLYVGITVGWSMTVIGVVARAGPRRASGPLATVVHVGLGLWLMMFGLTFLGSG